MVALTVAENVGSRVHTINGRQVEVSCHPSIRETQFQKTSEDQVRLGHFMINVRQVFTSVSRLLKILIGFEIKSLILANIYVSDIIQFCLKIKPNFKGFLMKLHYF